MTDCTRLFLSLLFCYFSLYRSITEVAQNVSVCSLESCDAVAQAVCRPVALMLDVQCCNAATWRCPANRPAVTSG